MLTIYAVSDSIGETAELVSRAAATQFPNEINVKRFPYVKTIEDANNFVNNLDLRAKLMVVSTIVQIDVREFLTQKCIEKGINIINILGPIINVSSRLLNKFPTYNPGAIWSVDDMYYKKIEAMEFAMQYDDSKDHNGIKHADVILVGLSRTSKTPLCMYLANKGIKALNVPLVPEVPVPDELFEIERKKVIGLTINPIELIEIRKHRLDKFSNGITYDIQYADEARILEEFDFFDKIVRRLRCKVIDVTKRAIEDTALIITESIGYKY